MIKLLTGIASENYSYAPGQVVELDPKTEARLVEGGQAEKVQTAKPKAKK